MEDYTAITTQLTFGDNGVQSIAIPITDNLIHESTEAFTVFLNATSTFVVEFSKSSDQTSVTILDNDGECT